jgi:hypothetical protein
MNCRNPWINSTVLKIELVELCHGVYHDSMVIEIYITISKKKKKTVALVWVFVWETWSTNKEAFQGKTVCLYS